MEPYRYDPYTGQPIPQPRPANNRAWLGSGYQPGVYQPGGNTQSPAQTQGGAGQQPGLIVRPVASFDEAKAVPTDFSGALTIMPDWAHGYIYAKALGDNGTPVFRAYRDVDSSSAQAGGYASQEALEQLRQEVNALREDLAEAKTPAKETAEKPAGKGSKS